MLKLGPEGWSAVCSTVSREETGRAAKAGPGTRGARNDPTSQQSEDRVVRAGRSRP